jgi:hypothetical protein
MAIIGSLSLKKHLRHKGSGFQPLFGEKGLLFIQDFNLLFNMNKYQYFG